MKKEITNLEEQTLKELRKLHEELRRGNSLKNKLLQGIFVGFGTFLGATVVVGLLIFILTKLASVQILGPVIQDIVDMVHHTQQS